MIFNLGRFFAFLFSRVHYDIYYFIPHMNTGGAEQVHLTTLKMLREEGYNVATIVTATPENSLKEEFKAVSTVFDIRRSNTTRMLFFLFLGFWSAVINRQKGSIVIGSHSYFFYRLIPFLKSDHKIIDVIHSLESGPEMRYGDLFNQVEKKIQSVVCVDLTTQALIKKYSNRKNVLCITNATDEVFFEENVVRTKVDKKGVFVGRYDKVKRPHMIEKLASNNSVEIGWIGEVPEHQKKAKIKYEGLLKDRKSLAVTMNTYDFLLLSSISEAFPMVIQEAMALGMIVISTDVGGISNHIRHLENGILVDCDTESKIITEFESFMNTLTSDNALAERISKNASSYAKEQFRYSVFKNSFLNILG